MGYARDRGRALSYDLGSVSSSTLGPQVINLEFRKVC